MILYSVLINFNYEKSLIYAFTKGSMTNSRINSFPRNTDGGKIKRDANKDRKEPRLFERISAFLIEVFRND